VRTNCDAPPLPWVARINPGRCKHDEIILHFIHMYGGSWNRSGCGDGPMRCRRYLLHTRLLQPGHHRHQRHSSVSDTIGSTAANGASYFDAEGFTGNYTDSVSNVSGNISLLTSNGWGSDTNEITAVPGWIYDNVFYPGANAPGTSNGYFDVGGLFFYLGPTSPPPVYVANLWAGNIAGEPGSPNTYTIQEGQLGGSNDLGGATGIGMSNSVPLVFPPTAPAGAIVFPESSSLSALLLCALCMAGGFFFRARHPGLIRRS